MANKQINELTEITSMEDTDLLVAYDLDEAGSEKTKKITRDNAMQYEVGTWTPVPADAASGGNTGSATSAYGYYTKIGRNITVYLNLIGIDTTGLTAGNSFAIQGLPFTSSSTTGFRAVGAVRTHLVTFADQIVANIATGVSHISFVNMTTATVEAAMLVSDINSTNTNMQATITYITS